MNLTDIFFLTAKRQPDHPAIIGPGIDDIYSYRLICEDIESIAERLKTAGIQPGNCIGLHYPSGREYIVLTYALWLCGACVVPIPVDLVPEEKQRICREICLNAFISTAETADVANLFQNGKAVNISKDIVLLHINRFRELPAGFHDINAAFLRFTSGTTGISKGVILSHETIYERILAANDALRIGPEDRIIWLLPMSYHFAVSIVLYLSFGATIVLLKNHLGATIIQATARNRGTIIYGSPVHYGLIAYDRSSLMMPGLRLAISTTAALKDEIPKAFYRRFKKPLVQAYGIIEVGLPCINLDKALERPDSVGPVLPSYEIDMLDIGLGDNLKAIRLRGKGFIDAYYDPWQTRKEIMADGWFSTGDLGMLDNEGYLYILGRSKEMISVGGMKLFPQEVESVLASHPGVSETCVYAHHDERFGEIPYALVVKAKDKASLLSETDLKDYCRQHLSPFKIPERILFVNALPRTASGKLIRQDSSRIKGKESTYED